MVIWDGCQHVKKLHLNRHAQIKKHLRISEISSFVVELKTELLNLNNETMGNATLINAKTRGLYSDLGGFPVVARDWNWSEGGVTEACHNLHR